MCCLNSCDYAQGGANSGSLPDLTDLNFLKPLSTPIDVSESVHDNPTSSHHIHRQVPLAPLIFNHATNNHLLAGGCAVVNNTQVILLPVLLFISQGLT